MGDPLVCPACEAALQPHDKACPSCRQPTAGQRHSAVLEGNRFRMPRRCACCLQPTDRTTRFSRADSGGYAGTFHTSFEIPHCASCAPVGKLFTAVCAATVVLAPVLMILLGDTQSPFLNDNAWLMVVLLPLLLTIVGLIVFPRLAPFRRVGHVRRCVPARVLKDGIELHNRAFAQLCESERA